MLDFLVCCQGSWVLRATDVKNKALNLGKEGSWNWKLPESWSSLSFKHCERFDLGGKISWPAQVMRSWILGLGFLCQKRKLPWAFRDKNLPSARFRSQIYSPCIMQEVQVTVVGCDASSGKQMKNIYEQ